jgi:hypothetical protein
LQLSDIEVDGHEEAVGIGWGHITPRLQVSERAAPLPVIDIVSTATLTETILMSDIQEFDERPDHLNPVLVLCTT